MISTFGDYEVDLDRLEVRRAGELVAVEPQVFDVLSYLVEHRDRLVTKEELLDNVWGDRFVSESALTSRIKSARQALGDNGRDQAVIKTVHGRGYRWVADVDDVETPTTPTTPESEPATRPIVGAGPEPGADVDAWPIVGRHDELDELDRVLADPGRDGVLLTGPAGVGKTRLARLCVDRAARAGLPVAHVAGHPEATGIPLAALAHLLPADVLEAHATSGDLARTVVFQRARTALEAHAEGQRLVLMIDNADHIDELSSALLGSLVASRSVFAVMTQRVNPGEVVAFDELVRGGQIVHVDLGPLDDTDVDVLLYRVLSGPIDLDSLRQLADLSRGRPGALRQLVDSCLATNSLARQDDVWRIVGPIDATVGVGRERSLISDLAPTTLAGAELLSIAQELDLDLATELVGADALDELDRAGLLALTTSDGSPRVSLAHAHIGLLLGERMGPLRTRRHKHRLVAALDPADLADVDRTRYVRWSVEVGDAVDLSLAVSAARQAVANAAGETADVLLDHLETTDAVSVARHLRGELAFRRGQIARAESILGGVDLDELSDVDAAALLRRLATIQFHVRGQFIEATDVLRDAETRFDGPAHLLVTAHRIGLLGFLGHVTELEALVDGLPADLDGPPKREVLRGLAQSRHLGGRFADVTTLLDEHDHRLAGLPDGAAQSGFEVSMATRIAALTSAGSIREAGDLVRRHLPVGRRTMLAWLPMAAARSELMAGRPRVARALISTPLAAVQSQNLLHAEPQMLGLLAQTTVRLDDADQALADAEQAAEHLGQLAGQMRWALLLSVADVHAIASTGGEAAEPIVDLLIEAADDAEAVGASVTAAELLVAAARNGADDVADRVAGLAASLEGRLWPLRVRHLHALADDDHDTLAAIIIEYRSLGYEGLANSIRLATEQP